MITTPPLPAARWHSLPISMALIASAPATAAEMTVTVTIPRLAVAEYHAPYVAMWVESDAGKPITTLATWYSVKLKANEGTKWLPELRSWWRKAGRTLAMPADGISSPTRPPGTHSVRFAGGTAPFGNLAPGNYRLMIEAAREVGGREIVAVPFQWPAKAAGGSTATGTAELGTVSLALKP